mgnify:FL=1
MSSVYSCAAARECISVDDVGGAAFDIRQDGRGAAAGVEIARDLVEVAACRLPVEVFELVDALDDQHIIESVAGCSCNPTSHAAMSGGLLSGPENR